MVEKKSAAKPEPEKVAPAKAEVVADHSPEVFVPDKAGAVVPKAEKKAEPEPPAEVHAGGHVLTEDKGWVVEEGT